MLPRTLLGLPLVCGWIHHAASDCDGYLVPGRKMQSPDAGVVIPGGSFRTRLICCVNAQDEKMLADPKDFNIFHGLLLLQSLNVTFAEQTAKKTARIRNGLR